MNLSEKIWTDNKTKLSLLFVDDVKEAVKELKELEIYKGLIDKSDAWRFSGDELCDLIESKLRAKIKEIFGEKLC